jgi:glycosyltransferase involved in cell wall biosynthesis
MRKKVLIIAYHFPPLGGGGVYRTLKFAKYLPLFGWEPIILTVSNPDHPIWDHSLLKEIPSDIQVFRAPALEFSRWEKKFSNLFKRVTKLKKEAKENEFNLVEDTNLSEPKLKNLLKRIYVFLTSWLKIPDDKVGWVPFALLEGLSLIKSKKVDLIYVTSPPHSSQLLGLLLSKLSGKPWVVDFRDEWVEYKQIIGGYSSSRLKFERKLVNKIFTNASFIIAITEFQKQTHQKNYPQAKRIEVIYNGYDAQDMNKARQREDKWLDGKFHICHCGYFYPNTAFPFFEVLKDFFNENPDLKGKIQVDLVGYLEKEYEDWIIQNQLGEIIKSWGYREHESAINFLLKSHLLLHLIGANGDFWKGVVTGKLFEYLASGKPILSLAPPNGEVEMIINQAKSGWVFNPQDHQGIKDKLKEVYQLHAQGKLYLENNWSFIQNFERKKLVEKLSEVFNKCLKNISQTVDHTDNK